jgi:hypothetical protein
MTSTTLIGILWEVEGRPRVAWELTVADGRITDIAMVGARETLREMESALLP